MCFNLLLNYFLSLHAFILTLNFILLLGYFCLIYDNLSFIIFGQRWERVLGWNIFSIFTYLIIFFFLNILWFYSCRFTCLLFNFILLNFWLNFFLNCSLIFLNYNFLFYLFNNLFYLLRNSLRRRYFFDLIFNFLLFVFFWFFWFFWFFSFFLFFCNFFDLRSLFRFVLLRNLNFGHWRWYN
mgnify:CR=1 FL=1